MLCTMKTETQGPLDVWFEDFAVGRVIETAAVTVTEAHVVAWASLTGDWHPLHMDEEWARHRSPFGKRVVHGPFVVGLGAGLMSRANVFGDAVIAWLGAEELRAEAPVFIGDTLHVRATVLQARLSQSDPTRGIVTLAYETVNQHDTVVMTCRYILMMRARSA
jgi:acyl dehydratase